MPAIDYRRARAELPLAEVLQLIGYEPRSRHGQQFRGPCPVHGARSATSRAFAVHLGKNLFHCFRCGAGGNTLDLHLKATQDPRLPFLFDPTIYFASHCQMGMSRLRAAYES